MAKSDLFLVASLLLLLVPLSSAQNIGGYNPIPNPKDPYIESLGKFAVDEHNKQTKTHHLKFHEVIGGRSQIVQGTNYDLKLRAGDGGLIRTYGALVFVDLDKNPNLKDFHGISRN